MKQSEIIIGNVYLCKVGTRKVRVRVVRECQSSRKGSRTSFIVRRIDTGNYLPKARTAAAFSTYTPPTVREVMTEVIL